jgi:hypothetical protein
MMSLIASTDLTTPLTAWFGTAVVALDAAGVACAFDWPAAAPATRGTAVSTPIRTAAVVAWRI